MGLVMKIRNITGLVLMGLSLAVEAQYGCGTPYNPPCQVQIQPRIPSGQDMYNLTNSFDPGKAFNDGFNSSQRYDLQEQELQLRKQEIELRRMEIEKRKRQLQQ